MKTTLNDNLETLQPKHDSRKSFYGKALLARGNACDYLYSYDTLIAAYDRHKKRLTVYLRNEFCLSATSRRHIAEFYAQETGVFLRCREILKNHATVKNLIRER